MLKLTEQEARGIQETLWETFRLAQQAEDNDLIIDINRAMNILDVDERLARGR